MGRLSYRTFLASQWDPVPLVKHDLSGKTILVVGANTGLGLEAAKLFASMGPKHLVLACRSLKKGEAAAAEIKTQTGLDGVAVRIVDLAVFSSVIAFAEAFEKEFDQLDIYVYNAATATHLYEQTVDGWESSLQINVLSCLLLSVLLLPASLKAASPSAQARVVVVASEAHFLHTITEDELTKPQLLELFNNSAYCTPNSLTPDKTMKHRYPLTKLLDVFITRELASRLSADSPLVVNTVNPGFCKTELNRIFRFPASVGVKLFEFLFARTAEMGSRVLVWGALGGRNRERDLHGAYISDAAVHEPSDFVLSDEGMQMQKRVWDESVAILSAVSPRFKELAAVHLKN
ncbi:NAD(P)-binding protein [Auriscalpium vulgare]|uniref:NAD(P)-binding protein n=1 Tax=Auriscalpium vulgare TaxID=40419 RepID=A0ACB8S3T3_9AGAM|nr:NAD(P)-binding protein [Auriscalpium vulgare]